MLSHLRRVATPVPVGSKALGLRLLHNTHFGLICPAESPEGQKIGIVKNLALMTRISVGITSEQKSFLMRFIGDF